MRDYNFNTRVGASRKIRVRNTLIGIGVVCAIFIIIALISNINTGASVFLIDTINIDKPNVLLDTPNNQIMSENLTTGNASDIVLNSGDFDADWTEISTADMSCEVGDYCTAFAKIMTPTMFNSNSMRIQNKAIIFPSIAEAETYYNALELSYVENYTISHYNIGNNAYLYETSTYIEISFYKGNVVGRMCVHANINETNFDLNDLLYYVNILEGRIT